MALDGLSGAETREYLTLLEEREKRLARRNLLALGQRITGFAPARHHALMAALLDRWITQGSGLDRLMIFLPPRHGKSLYASLFTPLAILGRYPDAKIMHISHTQRLADRFGRAIRNTIADPARNPFDGLEVRGDAAAKAQWETAAGGLYNAFGLNANPTGTPAEYLLVDDPIKGAEAAASLVQRDAAYDTLVADVWTRLEGPQKQVFMLTRWHEDDPAGRILPPGFAGRSGWYEERDTGLRWYVLSLPAVSEHDNDPLKRRPGEYLWPELHGEGSQLEAQRKRAEGKGGAWAKMVWAALYQQRPAPLEGLHFDAADFRYYPWEQAADPDWLRTLTIYGASDYAVTDGAMAADPDWTVHVVVGVDRDRRVYLLDLWRGRSTSDVWVSAFLDLVSRWGPSRWAEEGGVILSALDPISREQMHQRYLRGEPVAVKREKFPVTRSEGSKVARAASLAGLIAMGRFFLPSGAPFLPALEAEMKTFPTGRHDDQVDALALMARLLDKMLAGSAPEKTRRPWDGTTMGTPWERDQTLDPDMEDDAWPS